MRLSNQAAGFARRVRPLGAEEWRVTFHPTAATRCKTPGLPSALSARLIRYQVPGFRPSWLVTSLIDPHLETRHELVELYHRRWSIETVYREWKHGLDIQNLRAHTPAGILKEVHAQLLLSNLVRWLMTEAVEDAGDPPLDLSFLTALSHVKNALLFLALTHPTPPRLEAWHRRLLDQIRTARIRKRPGRSYPRPNDGKIKYKGRGKYQLPAKLENT